MSSKSRYIFYFLLILLTIYTDSPLQEYLDTFGESFVPIVSILGCVVAYPLNYLKRSDIFIRKFRNLVIYTLVVSIIALSLYVMDDKLIVRGEFLPMKMVKVMLYFVGYLCFLSLFVNLTRKMTVDQILMPFLSVFFILTIILTLELASIPDAFGFLHNHPTPYWRVRLLCAESSWTATQIQVFGILAFYYVAFIKRSKPLTILVLCLMVYHIACSGSKTLLISVFLFVALFAYYRIKDSRFSVKLYTIVSVAVISAILFYLLLPRLTESIEMDLEEATSTVTRTYTIICAYGICLMFPFGTGFQTYIDLLPKVMKDNTWVIDYLFDSSNLSEIQELYSGVDGKYLSAKSFLAQSSIYWGIFGTIYFMIALVKRFRIFERFSQSEGFWTLKGLFFIMLVEISFATGLTYDFLAFIGVILVMKNRRLEL